MTTKTRTPSELGTFEFPQSACLDDLMYRLAFGYRIYPPHAHASNEWHYHTLGMTRSKPFKSKQAARAAMREADLESYYWEAHRNGLCR